MGSLGLGFLGIVVLFAAILTGVNATIALGLVGALGLTAVAGFSAAASTLSAIVFETTHPFHFGVIPLFLLMGYFAMRAGLGEDLLEAGIRWFGNLPGGLAISTTLGAAAFGAASGSSVGTATVFTKLALPQMLDAGYDRRMASASIAIAGTLAVMIPPSTVMVIVGLLTGSSIGKLLIAGVIPGIAFALVLCAVTVLTALRHPDAAPRAARRYTLVEKLYSLRLAGPLLLVIAIIVFGLYLGVLTPAEAGAMGAAVMFVLALIRQHSLKRLRLAEILRETVKSSAIIFAIIICALLFSRFLALSDVTTTVAEFVAALNVNRWAIVLIVVVIYFIVGAVMDATALLATTLPITYPVMMKLGFDPVWFGVFVVLLVEIGAVTPPVGISCFVVQAASEGRVQIEDVFSGLIPYVVAGFAMLFLLCVFPQLALYLPQSMH